MRRERHGAGHPYADSHNQSKSAVISRSWTIDGNLSMGTETYVPSRCVLPLPSPAPELPLLTDFSTTPHQSPLPVSRLLPPPCAPPFSYSHSPPPMLHCHLLLRTDPNQGFSGESYPRRCSSRTSFGKMRYPLTCLIPTPPHPTTTHTRACMPPRAT